MGWAALGTYVGAVLDVSKMYGLFWSGPLWQRLTYMEWRPRRRGEEELTGSASASTRPVATRYFMATARPMAMLFLQTQFKPNTF